MPSATSSPAIVDSGSRHCPQNHVVGTVSTPSLRPPLKKERLYARPVGPKPEPGQHTPLALLPRSSVCVIGPSVTVNFVSGVSSQTQPVWDAFAHCPQLS